MTKSNRRSNNSPAEGLFPPDRYRKRRHELQADYLVTELRGETDWNTRWALAASQLRGQARALDLAEYAATADPSPYAAQCVAITARELRDTLLAYGLGMGGGGGDPFAAFLASLDTDQIAG